MNEKLKLKDMHNNTIEEINLVGDKPSAKKSFLHIVILIITICIFSVIIWRCNNG